MCKKNSSLLSVLSSNNRQESNTDTVVLRSDVASHETRRNAVMAQVLSSSTDSREITVHRVPFDEDKTLIRRESTVLHAVKSECGNYFTIESEDLDMSLTEASMEALKDAFESVLAITWELYVMGDPKKMTQGALELREHLIETYRLV